MRLLHVGLSSIPWLAAEERDGCRGEAKREGCVSHSLYLGDIASALSTASSFMQPHYSFTTLLLIWYPFQGMKSKASHANTLKRWQLASVYLYECASMIEEPIELPLEYLRGINHGHGQTMKIDLVGPNTGNLSTVFLIRLVGCVQD